MKKLLIILLLSTCGLTAFSQKPCIHCEYDKFKSDNLNIFFTKTILEDGAVVLSSVDANCQVIHYFKDNVSYLCLVIPPDNKWVNGFVSELNKSANPISKNEWSYYADGGIVTINLKYSDTNNEWVFYYQ